MSTIKINELATSSISLSDFFAKADANGIMTKNNIQNLQTFLNSIGISGYKGMVTPNVSGVPQLDGADITENGVYIVSQNGDYGSFVGLDIDNKYILLDVKNIDTTPAYTKTEIPLNITFDSIPTEGSINAVESEGIAAETRNYPYLKDISPTGSSSKLSKLQCQEFVLDLQIFNDFDSDKKYSISSVARNLSSLWLIRVSKTDLDGTSNSSDILEFRATISPENANGKSTHTLLSFNNTKLKGEIIVDWSKVTDGGNYFSMTPALGYELDTNIFKGYNPRYTSRSLTQNVRVLEEGNYLTPEQVDKIIYPFYLYNTNDDKDYFIGDIRYNDSSENPQTRVSIYSIDSSNVITLVSRYSTNESVTGIQRVNLTPQNSDNIWGNVFINFDEIPPNINYDFSSLIRATGYIFKKEFYKNKASDLSVQVDDFETIYDAVQVARKGRINVGLSTLRSYENATSKEDFLNVNCNKQISNLFDFEYIDTLTCKLLLIDSNGLMWWRLATNAGVQIFTSTIEAFEDGLTDLASVNGEKRKQIESYTIGNAPTFLTLFQTLDIDAIKESEGRYVASDCDINEDVGRIYWLNPSSNQFELSTIPAEGRNGDCRSGWNFDMYQNYVVISGYKIPANGVGSLLFSSDYGETFKTIFNVATTGNLNSTERLTAHLHGCYIDRYNNNRIYLVTGDYSFSIPNTGKIFYTDNPEDLTPSWIKMEIDFVGSSEDNEQYISIFSTPENVLFGGDMRNNSIMRMNRVLSGHTKREVAELLTANNSGVIYTPQSWSRENDKEPVVCFNGVGDVGGVPASIYATMDGIKFFKIWEDTIIHSSFFNVNGITQTYKGNLYSMMSTGVNARYSNGLTLLKGSYKIL